MKIKKSKFEQILRLHLLHSRLYKFRVNKHGANLLERYNLTQAVSNFKKILHIIYQFHKAGRKILFVGASKELELKINRSTSHSAVSTKTNLQGFLLQNDEQKEFFKQMPLQGYVTKPDLIVLFSSEKAQTIISESSLAKIPLIVFNAECISNLHHGKNLYETAELSLRSTSLFDKSLFVLGLNFLFRKPRKSSVG